MQGHSQHFLIVGSKVSGPSSTQPRMQTQIPAPVKEKLVTLFDEHHLEAF